MKFELISSVALDNESIYKLKMLAISTDENTCRATMGRVPEVGEDFVQGTSWPAQKDGLVAATSEDYEKYGTREAKGVFRRVA
jgi:hypothetical protein